MRPSDVDETLHGGPPVRAVTELARAKARAVAATRPDAVVLGADTVVVLGDEVFGKPLDAADARAMLQRLRGRAHEVITAVALVHVASGREAATAVVSRVVMAPIDDATIDAYVASGEPLDKAGAYAIQGRGGALVVGVAGSYTNVVGLPIRETAGLLRTFGVPLRPEAET